MFATVTYVVKHFACGGLSSLLYLNFVHDSVHYLCANCDKFCQKNFACGGLSSLLYFNFIHDFINYLYTTVTNVVNKILPAAVFRRSCISISFKISLIIFERLRQILLKNFASGGLSSLLYFNLV